jgi:hypothetical protein
MPRLTSSVVELQLLQTILEPIPLFISSNGLTMKTVNFTAVFAPFQKKAFLKFLFQ